jgi:hypothetical protein|tara:strand:- start:739 stop:999 length:261 start_codon:yes stop_codon:yes gene_type:complete
MGNSNMSESKNKDANGITLEAKESVMDERYVVLADLANRVSRSTVAVIDTVVQRGGFKGEELSTIGQLRDQAIESIQLVENIQNDA